MITIFQRLSEHEETKSKCWRGGERYSDDYLLLPVGGAPGLVLVVDVVHDRLLLGDPQPLLHHPPDPGLHVAGCKLQMSRVCQT